MSIADYKPNPALRPTVLANEVLKNVYRPSELPARKDAATPAESRESSRAA